MEDASLDGIVEYVGEKFDEYEQKLQEAYEVSDSAHGYCNAALRACGVASYGNYGPQTVEIARRYAKTFSTIHTEILGLNSFLAKRDSENRAELQQRMACQERQ